MEMSGHLHALATLSRKEIASGTQHREGWVAPRIGLDIMEKISLLPIRNRTPLHLIAISLQY
jgi:hypothetical protein